MNWWEARSSLKPLVAIRYAKCPVCRASFGRAPKMELVSFHCDECQATYTFEPGQDKPTAKLDSAMRRSCHCSVCQTKQEDVEPIKQAQLGGFNE